MPCNFLKSLLMAYLATMLVGCASRQGPALDYTAFKQSRPRSIVILPPINESPDVLATYSMLSQMTRPLAESGYYVFPVALVDETFKQNGLTVPNDIQSVAPAKLREIFGADAALYVTVKKYGATYTILNSVAVVSATAQLVDLRTGTTIWYGAATANNNEGGNSGGGLIGALVAAAVKQIINSTADTSHPVAAKTSLRLLSAGQLNGVLYGPYSQQYGSD